MVRRAAAAAAVALIATPACTNSAGPPPRQAGGFQQAQQGQPGPYPSQPAPQAQAAPPSPQPPPQQGAVQQPGQVPPLGAILSDPNTLQNIIAGALAGTAASLSTLTGGEKAVLEQGIRMTAAAQAKGKRPEGQLLSAKLQQGAHAEATVSLQPGACYTVVGFGGPGVFGYQLNLITAPPLPPQVLAQSDVEGNDPVVGPGDQCIKNPYPLPMQVKVDMHLVKGQGLVGAQLYRK